MPKKTGQENPPADETERARRAEYGRLALAEAEKASALQRDVARKTGELSRAEFRSQHPDIGDKRKESAKARKLIVELHALKRQLALAQSRNTIFGALAGWNDDPAENPPDEADMLIGRSAVGVVSTPTRGFPARPVRVARGNIIGASFDQPNGTGPWRGVVRFESGATLSLDLGGNGASGLRSLRRELARQVVEAGNRFPSDARDDDAWTEANGGWTWTAEASE